MNCCEPFELLASLVIDGEATLEERGRLEEHLETCPGCRAYFEDLQRIHGTFAREDASLPEGFAARVMYRVRETPQDRPEEAKAGKPEQEKKKTLLFPHWRRWAALAACCALAAVSLWTVRGTGGVKDAPVATDRAAPNLAEAKTDGKAVDSGVAAQEADVLPEGDTAAKDESLEEAPPPLPEEYVDVAKSAAKEGAAEGAYQPIPAPQTVSEPAQVSSAPPEPVENSWEADEPPASDTSGASPEEASSQPEGGFLRNELTDQAEPVPEEEKDLPPEDPLESPEEAPDTPAEGPEAPEVLPEAPAENVAPAEVIGVPEPGILIAYGGVARTWVETVLGLEWADGGSYPLTAEQYGSLIRALDEAGETYRIEPGEGYCLMTE